MRRIHFFATPADIRPVLRTYEGHASLKFVETGHLTTPDRGIYLTSTEIPEVGISTHETGNASKTFMVSHRDSLNQMRRIVGAKGEARWTLDNGDNEDTVMMTLAGLWNGAVLLPGIMDTLHDSAIAQQLMKWFASSLKKNGFKKVDLFWVGQEALAMGRAGVRMAKNAVQSPPEYDLIIPVDAVPNPSFQRTAAPPLN